MLVKVGQGGTLSPAEKEFVECLRAIPLTCLAAVDVHVGEHGTRQIDAVLLTPRGITVAEVKGFRRRQSGILDVTGDGPWQISDADVELADESVTSPSDQLEQSVFAVKNKLERALLDPGHVCGAVVLVPARGVVVRPARTTLRPGLDVIVANVPDATELRIYVEGFSAAARDWTADRVLAAAQALGLDNGPSRAELLADGFSANAPTPMTASTPQYHRPKPKPVPAQPSRSHTMGAWTALALALAGMVLVGGIVVTALMADDGGHESGGPPATTVAPTSAPRTTAKACWPLQNDC